jgi:hypothetical protein
MNYRKTEIFPLISQNGFTIFPLISQNRFTFIYLTQTSVDIFEFQAAHFLKILGLTQKSLAELG